MNKNVKTDIEEVRLYATILKSERKEVEPENHNTAKQIENVLKYLNSIQSQLDIANKKLKEIKSCIKDLANHFGSNVREVSCEIISIIERSE